MKLLVLAISVQLISESFQRLTGFFEVRPQVIERKSLENPGLSQSPCATKIDADYWSRSCSNCTFCNSTEGNGTTIFSASCKPCNNYTWSSYDTTVQSKITTNFSSADNLQRYWYGDCQHDWTPFSECNFCYTCVRSNYAYQGWNCATCKAWKNSSGNSTNTTSTSCRSQTFGDYDWSSGRYISGNCSSCNTTDSSGYLLSSWVNCWPGANYSYINNDYSVHAYNTTNYSSSDNVQRVFTSDCRNPYVSDRINCGFSLACTKQPYRWFGFDCFFTYQNNSNTTNTTKTQEYYSWDDSRGIYLRALCSFAGANGSNSTYSSRIEDCRPLNYSWVTWNTTVSGPIWVYNSSSSDSYTRYFTTDCTGSNVNDCYWVTACSKSIWTSVGFECWVFNAKNTSNSTSNNTNNTYFSGYDPYRGFYIWASCNYTSLYNRSINCAPYAYNYATSDRSLQSTSVYNSSSGAYDQLFYTDCSYSSDYSNCYWVTRCYTRSWNNSMFCTVSNYKGSNSSKSSNSSNSTNKAFRYDLGQGNDWCANCTQNNNSSNSTSVSCKPCTSYTPYTSVRCSTQIHYFQNNYGGSTCANCTSCNTGFFNCAPCGFINVNAVQAEGVEAVQPQVLPFEQEFWENQ